MALLNFAILFDLLSSTSGTSGGFFLLLRCEVAIRLLARAEEPLAQQDA